MKKALIILVIALVAATLVSCESTEPPLRIGITPAATISYDTSSLIPVSSAEVEDTASQSTEETYTREPSSLNITFDTKISPEYDLFSFDYYFTCTLLKDEDNTLKEVTDHKVVSLKINDSSTGNLIQELDINNEYYTYGGIESPEIDLFDINFDGYSDVFIRVGGHTFNPNYLCYIWDSQKEIYTQWKDFEMININWVDIDSEKRLIKTYTRIPDFEHHHSIYKATKNEFICESYLVDNTRYYAGDGKGQYYIMSFTEYQNINGEFEITDKFRLTHDVEIDDLTEDDPRRKPLSKYGFIQPDNSFGWKWEEISFTESYTGLF